MTAKADEAPEAGFSLIEVIIAFVILSMAIGVAVQSVGLSASAISRAQRQDVALEALQEILAIDQNATGAGVRSGTLESDVRWAIRREAVEGLNNTQIEAVTVEFFQAGKTVPYDRFVSFRPLGGGRQ